MYSFSPAQCGSRQKPIPAKFKTKAKHNKPAVTASRSSYIHTRRARCKGASYTSMRQSLRTKPRLANVHRSWKRMRASRPMQKVGEEEGAGSKSEREGKEEEGKEEEKRK